MAFGQPSGPPASAKQVEELLTLLRDAGHSDFRDARGPMGFNQRQAGGKFTRDEATAFIEQLEAAQQESSEAGEPDRPDRPANEPTIVARPPSRPAPRSGGERLSAAEQTLRRFPTPMLAAELQRRGWIVMEP